MRHRRSVPVRPWVERETSSILYGLSKIATRLTLRLAVIIASVRAHGVSSTREMKTFFDRFRLYSLTIKVLVEATAGIEPACTDLQSAASPLRHVANTGKASTQAYIGGKASRQSRGETCLFAPIAAQGMAFRVFSDETYDVRFRRRAPQYGGRSGPHCRRDRFADPVSNAGNSTREICAPGVSGPRIPRS